MLKGKDNSPLGTIRNSPSNILVCLSVYNQGADEHIGKTSCDELSVIILIGLEAKLFCTSKFLRIVLWYGNKRLMEILQKKINGTTRIPANWGHGGEIN